METPQTLLRQYFGYAEFRSGQEELIQAQLAGRDVFGIMPTGGGKSICYQIPGMMLPGITLVVSPLISLMMDQVMALKNAGIPAAFINSSLSPEQIRKVYGNLRYGMYKIVYIAPERLLTDGFLAVCQEVEISLLAVDEAHCISQWGQDFRPSYLKIVEFLQLLPRRPVVAAFTATATEQVRQDVERILSLQNPVRVVTGFDRPNLYYEVMRPKNKLDALLELLKDRQGRSGIVYCATRKDTESVCEELQNRGFQASRYHAGLTDEERRSNQDDFVYDRCRIMVATNAFGMGIDKSNVSFVIHYSMPKSLEAYYQEAGRAGRDGEKAECLLLFSQRDIRTAQFLIANSSENEELSQQEREMHMAQELARLDAMIGYCKTTDCLRGYILSYFGEAHEAECGNCGSCLAQFSTQDITRQTQIILSCIQRMYNKLGYSLGATAVIQVLRGGRNKRMQELGLQELPTYGMLSALSREQLTQILEALESQGYIRTDPVHNGIMLLTKSRTVLYEGSKVSMRMRLTEEKKKSVTRHSVEADSELVSRLKQLRLRLAREEHVPMYVIFNNAALTDMAERMPATMEEFLDVSGVGQTKARKYGKAFLKVIAQYRSETE